LRGLGDRQHSRAARNAVVKKGNGSQLAINGVYVLERDICIKQLNSNSPWKRIDALEKLRESSDALLLLAARSGLTDSHSEVRRVSADIIGECGTARDCYRLVIASTDKSWKVRSSAVEALGSLGCVNAAGVVSTILQSDRHFVVRRDAASALVNVNKDAEQILRDRLALEKSEIVRIAIRASLYSLGDRGMLPAILSALGHDNVLVRHNAINMLAGSTIDQGDVVLLRKEIERFVTIETEDGIREEELGLRNRIDSRAPL